MELFHGCRTSASEFGVSGSGGGGVGTAAGGDIGMITDISNLYRGIPVLRKFRV